MGHEYKWEYIRRGLVSLMVIYVVIYLPLHVIFDLANSGVYFWLYCLATSVFFADFVHKAFFIKNKDRDALNYEPVKPFMNRLWVGLDAVACVPWLAISSFSGLSFLQLSKIFRVSQSLQLIQHHEVRYERFLTILFFGFWLIVAVHLLSCGWIASVGIDADYDLTTNYVRALYWTITTLTSVGYGDITPSTNIQMLYAMFVQLLGIGAFGYLIAHVVSVLSKKDLIELKYADQIEQLTTTLKRRKLSKSVQKRILNYYAYMRHEKLGYDETTFLDTLPKSLRTEVAWLLRKEFIEKIEIFKNVDERFISEIALELELHVATPGDYLVRAGEVGDEMYLIVSGKVSIWDADEKDKLATLKEGDYFGELVLFGNQQRNATARAADFCNLYILKKEVFDAVVSRHPLIAKQIKEKAHARGLS